MLEEAQYDNHALIMRTEPSPRQSPELNEAARFVCELHLQTEGGDGDLPAGGDNPKVLGRCARLERR